MNPLKPGVRFTSRIYFENLREEELGALWWALSLPGKEGVTYRHKLGMGKPLGMGAVSLRPHLYLTNRLERYSTLFGSGTGCEAGEEAEPRKYVEAFEAYVLQELGLATRKTRLIDVERIQMLLAMMQWRESDPEWIEKTRYMEIERGEGRAKTNEYKERPVLPDPLAVQASGSLGAHTLGAPRHESLRAAVQKPPVIEKVGQSIPVQYERGEVDYFNNGKGVIIDSAGNRLFVHKSRLAAGLDTLEPGQPVTFRTGKGMKWKEAFDVRLKKDS